MTVSAFAIWPPDAEAKVLLCLRVKANIDEVFQTLYVKPELSTGLHKLRNDTNLTETQWYGTRDKLPQVQYTWDAPIDGQAVGRNRWRKLRFESPASALATKPFQNEEVHHVVEYAPGRKYVMELSANTTAPYGDKFTVQFKSVLVCEDKSSCLLHVVFSTQWSPSMSRMMKAVVNPALEGGVRGTYKQLRQVLETIHPCEDISEVIFNEKLAKEPSAVPGPEQPAIPAAAAVVQPAVQAVPVAQPVVVQQAVETRHMPMQPKDLLSYAFSQLVWNQQVLALSDVVGTGVRSHANEGVAARVMASLVTLALIHSAVSMLSSLQSFCRDRGSVLWLLCLPITHLIDLPDSLSEVLISVAIVAAVNTLIIWGATASVGNGATARTAGALPAAAVTSAVLDTTASTTSGSISANVADGANNGATDAAAAAVTATAKVDDKKAAAPAAPGKPVHVSKAAPKRADIVPPKGRVSQASLAAMITPPVVKPVSRDSNGSIPAAASAAAAAAATPTIFATASVGSAAAAAGSTSTTQPASSAPQQQQQKDKEAGAAADKAQDRKSSSGATTDLKKQESVSKKSPPALQVPTSAASMEMTSLPSASSGPKPGVAFTVNSPISSTGSGNVVAASKAEEKHLTKADSTGSRLEGKPPRPTDAADKKASKLSESGASVNKTSEQVDGKAGLSKSGSTVAVASEGSNSAAKDTSSSTNQATPSAGTTPTMTSTSTTKTDQSKGSDVTGAHASGSESVHDELPSPLHTASPDIKKTSQPSSPRHLTHRSFSEVHEGDAHKGGLPTAGLSDGVGAGSAKVSMTGTSGQVFGAQYPPSAAAIAAAVASTGAGNASGGPEPMKAWMKSVTDSMDLLAEGFKGAFTFKSDDPAFAALKQPASSPNLSTLPSVDQQHGAQHSASEPSFVILEGRDDLPDKVEEEVFENERFQPFRGWGHTWPGHFLPSDRAGHWSDANGGPGGNASMIFEQVEPVLPPGYMWLEDEWQLDMEGFERAAVDDQGWTYALDFNYLDHPPLAGQGKCTMKHFVRRRRWFRTRVKITSDMLPVPIQQAMSKEVDDLDASVHSSVDLSKELSLSPPSPPSVTRGATSTSPMSQAIDAAVKNSNHHIHSASTPQIRDTAIAHHARVDAHEPKQMQMQPMSALRAGVADADSPRLGSPRRSKSDLPLDAATSVAARHDKDGSTVGSRTSGSVRKSSDSGIGMDSSMPSVSPALPEGQHPLSSFSSETAISSQHVARVTNLLSGQNDGARPRASSDSKAAHPAVPDLSLPATNSSDLALPGSGSFSAMSSARSDHGRSSRKAAVGKALDVMLQTSVPEVMGRSSRQGSIDSRGSSVDGTHHAHHAGSGSATPEICSPGGSVLVKAVQDTGRGSPLARGHTDDHALSRSGHSSRDGGGSSGVSVSAKHSSLLKQIVKSDDEIDDMAIFESQLQ